MQILDWGQVTPESANLSTNTFVYVYNHDLTSMEKVDRTIRFIIGRLFFYDNHLPKDPIHKIKKLTFVDSKLEMKRATLFIKNSS